MRIKEKCAIKNIAFILLLVLLIIYINRVFTAKYLLDQREPHTITYEGFYKMKKGSIDVLILGTSQAASGFNPQDFYDSEQLRAYNLASSGQPVWASYYWLKECLKYQKPSVVIFDCNYLFSNYTNEACNRKVLDSMRLGRNKYNAIKAAVYSNTETKESPNSYYLPFIRYHARWSSLNESDFSRINSKLLTSPKGFWFCLHTTKFNDYKPLNGNTKKTTIQFKKDSFEYFEKIVLCCKENGIKLVLVKTPTHLFTEGQHNAVNNYSDSASLPFYDFNTKELYNNIQFEYRTDMNDAGKDNAHPNIRGANKMSKYLAKEIVRNGWAKPFKDEQWETSKQFNDGLYKDFELINTTDFSEYLKLLKDDRYTVIMSVKDEASKSLSEEMKKNLSVLGLKETWEDAYQKSFVAVIEKNCVKYEKQSKELIDYNTSIRNGLIRLKIKSAGFTTGNQSSIKLNEVEYSRNIRGFNIVVYNNDRHCVIDAVNFDTWSEDLVCNR